MSSKQHFLDPSLFVGSNYIDGEWCQALSGKQFEVKGWWRFPIPRYACITADFRYRVNRPSDFAVDRNVSRV